jgi:hypothetical protein
MLGFSYKTRARLQKSRLNQDISFGKNSLLMPASRLAGKTDTKNGHTGNSHGNAYIGDTHFNVGPATQYVLSAEKTP